MVMMLPPRYVMFMTAVKRMLPNVTSALGPKTGNLLYDFSAFTLGTSLLVRLRGFYISLKFMLTMGALILINWHPIDDTKVEKFWTIWAKSVVSNSH